ncbi:MAG: cation-efflux pump [Pseudomonadota bacterium]|nr:cation-efflux pump [Pseudomonadota bacterium]
MQTEKQKVALISLAASAALSAAKLAAALVTGSLGILSEAIHGLLDTGATIVTYFAVRLADEPADETHQYGHAKAESISALIATGLLFVTTFWIIAEALSRLWTGEDEVTVAWWAAAIVAVSVVVDYNRAKALKRVALLAKSEALAADALHFSSDMWSSLAVLAGLGAVHLGYPEADALAALVVALFVALAGLRLGRRTIDALLDAAPEGATERIAAVVRSTDGVLAMKRCRVRAAGAVLFIDVSINVRRTLPLDDVAEIKDRVAAEILKLYRSADVSVTTNPVPLDNETIFDKVMLAARRRSLAIHHLTVQIIGERTSVSFDLEVDGAMPLAHAHEVATAFERSLADELGSDVEIDTHIEPLLLRGVAGAAAAGDDQERIEQLLARFADEGKFISDIHNVRVRRNEHGLFVSYHCRVDGARPVETAHEAIDAIEGRLRAKLREVRRVIAHAEPLRES